MSANDIKDYLIISLCTGVILFTIDRVLSIIIKANMDTTLKLIIYSSIFIITNIFLIFYIHNRKKGILNTQAINGASIELNTPITNAQKTAKRQKELEIKEEKKRKIQLIKSLSSRKKEILRLFYEKRSQQLTQSREVDEMVKADILEIVSDFIPYRRISKKILMVSAEIEPWALEIVRDNPNILD